MSNLYSFCHVIARYGLQRKQGGDVDVSSTLLHCKFPGTQTIKTITGVFGDLGHVSEQGTAYTC